MTRLRLLIGMWLLTACAAPIPQSSLPAYAPTPTYGLAGQGVFMEQTSVAQERTRTAFEAAVAEATAIAQQTQSAYALAGTHSAATSAVRATELHFQETESAVTQTSRETQLAFNITLDAATSAARSTESANVITATAAAHAAERQASDETVAGWFWVVFGLLLAALGLWYAIQIGRGLARRADPCHDPNLVRVVRTSIGPILIIPLPSGGFSRELLASPGLPAPATAGLEESQFDTDEELPLEPDDAPMYSNGRLSGFYNRAQSQKLCEADEANRKFVLWFLRKCIGVAGRNSNVIPPHDKIGVATETWAKATDLLAIYIEKRRGRNGGTWLVGEYATLADLWLAVGERRLIPKPSGRRVIIEHSPSPTETLNVN